MKSFVISRDLSNNLSATVTKYDTLWADAGTQWGTDITLNQNVVSDSGTMSNLRIKLATAPGSGGSGKGWTFTVYKNGSPTALTVTISETATTGQDTTHSFTYADGDVLSLQAAPISTPTLTASVHWSIQNVCDTAKVSLIASGPGVPSANQTAYHAISDASTAGWGSASSRNEEIFPTGGTISRLRLKAKTAPGSGKSCTVTLVINGSDTTLVCALSDANTTNIDSIHSVTIAAGDRVWLKSVTSSGMTALGALTWSFDFTATTDGESVLMASQTLSQVSQLYFQPFGATGASNEANSQVAFPACTLKNLYFEGNDGNGTLVSPGSGKSRAARVKVAGSNSTIVATLSDADTLVSDTTHSVDVTADQLVGLTDIPTSIPAASHGSYGLVVYVAPPVTTNDHRSAEVQGKISTNDHRSAEVQGKISTNDHRAAEVQGKTSTNSARSAEIHGKITTNSTRSAEIQGKTSANDHRAAEVQGKLSTNDARNAEIHGVNTTGNARAAEIAGGIISTDHRAAEVQGKTTANDHRSAEVHGKTTGTSSRASEIHGIGTTESARAAEIRGADPPNIATAKGKITGAKRPWYHRKGNRLADRVRLSE